MGAAVKRLPAHVRRRLSGNAKLEQHLAVERAFAHEMAAIIREVDRVVGPHVDAVGAGILPLAPGAQEVAVAVEDDDRVLAAVEDVDVIVLVDADRADLLE